MEAQTTKVLKVELFQIEMPSSGIKSCSTCDTAESILFSAIEEVASLFKTLNYKIAFDKTIIKNVREAEEASIIASPTIRVGGFDFYPQHMADSSEEREWYWRGSTITTLTKATLIEVIMKGYLEPYPNERLKTGLSPYVLNHLSGGRNSESNCGCK